MKKIQLFTTLLTISSLSIASSKQSVTLPVDKQGYTSMHHAVLRDDTATIKILAAALPHEINRPSEEDSIKKQTFNDTPAHIAAFHGKWNALTTLISLGADLTCRNIANNTPANVVLTKEYQKYQSALNHGNLLKKELLKRKTNSITTQTKCLQQVSVSSQTDLEESYQNSSTSSLPSYKATISILPPCYPSPPPYQTTSSLNPEAQPYIPASFESFFITQLDSPNKTRSTTPHAPHTKQSPTFPTIQEIDLEKKILELLDKE